MKDVAARAGVGLKTVSRVVNGEPGVTSDTAERVQAAISALGFRRNDSARILRKGRTASVGLVLEDIADPFYSALSRAVEEVSRLHGSLLFTGSSDEDPEREEQLALAFCARRVDGLVIVPAAGADHRYLAPEVRAGIATVFIDRPPLGIEADTVLTANAAGAREGTAHLIGRGHRRIAFLGDSPDIHTAAERLRGYREAMADAGLPVDPSWISLGPTSPERVGAALATALSGPEPVTALFCGNNRVTVAALRRLRTFDRPVAVVGFDDLEFADLLSPGLTVVAQDPAGLGRTAAQLLFARLDGYPGPARHLELPARLIPRGSGELPPT
ncbi:LacI family DNA-binding transcriptional regulator [Streptomyces sp. NPDC092296]|uniref:LacI family DNA-binding transcriptional regulator n=1 Tax=Streptomyces sp. NPDC092296 TaxID=3366012 RepID=UPI003825157B